MLRDESHRERIGRVLAKGPLPTCVGLTIDITAEYDQGASNVPPSLSMSWAVNSEADIFVGSAWFGFIVDEAKNYGAGGNVEYGVNQRSFAGYLEVPWTLSLPTTASRAYLHLYLRDSTGNETECGTEVAISNLP